MFRILTGNFLFLFSQHLEEETLLMQHAVQRYKTELCLMENMLFALYRRAETELESEDRYVIYTIVFWVNIMFLLFLLKLIDTLHSHFFKHCQTVYFHRNFFRHDIFLAVTFHGASMIFSIGTKYLMSGTSAFGGLHHGTVSVWKKRN